MAKLGFIGQLKCLINQKEPLIWINWLSLPSVLYEDQNSKDTIRQIFESNSYRKVPNPTAYDSSEVYVHVSEEFKQGLATFCGFTTKYQEIAITTIPIRLREGSDTFWSYGTDKEGQEYRVYWYSKQSLDFIEDTTLLQKPTKVERIS